ncbi:MAG: WXG100 family type VII secretion target [Nocardioides sp.]|nr:WXG100 family type VII secretion target [Nocardioides sp.]
MPQLGDLKVGYEALDQAAADILTASSDLDDRLDQLERFMNAQKEHWSGQDAAAYEEARLKWNKAMLDMNGILREVARSVNLSKEEYMAAERNNANRFQR